MSKTALKKELVGYTKEQLIEVVLDLYASRTEVKEYFKFFLNPDSKALFEKFQKNLDKELSRVKRHTSKARISVIKKSLKDFKSFQPETSYCYKLYEYIIASGLYFENYYYFSEAQYNGFCNIVNDYLDFADRNGELDSALKSVERIVSPLNIGSRQFQNKITDAYQAYINRKRI